MEPLDIEAFYLSLRHTHIQACTKILFILCSNENGQKKNLEKQKQNKSYTAMYFDLQNDQAFTLPVP